MFVSRFWGEIINQCSRSIKFDRPGSVFFWRFSGNLTIFFLIKYSHATLIYQKRFSCTGPLARSTTVCTDATFGRGQRDKPVLRALWTLHRTVIKKRSELQLSLRPIIAWPAFPLLKWSIRMGLNRLTGSDKTGFFVGFWRAPLLNNSPADNLCNQRLQRNTQIGAPAYYKFHLCAPS